MKKLLVCIFAFSIITTAYAGECVHEQLVQIPVSAKSNCNPVLDFFLIFGDNPTGNNPLYEKGSNLHVAQLTIRDSEYKILYRKLSDKHKDSKLADEHGRLVIPSAESSETDHQNGSDHDRTLCAIIKKMSNTPGLVACNRQERIGTFHAPAPLDQWSEIDLERYFIQSFRNNALGNPILAQDPLRDIPRFSSLPNGSFPPLSKDAAERILMKWQVYDCFKRCYDPEIVKTIQECANADEPRAKRTRKEEHTDGERYLLQ